MFIRERYILVAAIVTMIILGVCGNCVIEKCKVSISRPLVANKDVRGSEALVVYQNKVQSTPVFDGP